jgi:hypothetical protein
MDLALGQNPFGRPDVFFWIAKKHKKGRLACSTSGRQMNLPSKWLIGGFWYVHGLLKQP